MDHEKDNLVFGARGIVSCWVFCGQHIAATIGDDVTRYYLELFAKENDGQCVVVKIGHAIFVGPDTPGPGSNVMWDYYFCDEAEYYFCDEAECFPFELYGIDH